MKTMKKLQGTGFEGLTHDDFTRILGEIVQEEGKAVLLVSGVYEVLSEFYNNDILDQWKKEQEAKGDSVVIKQAKDMYEDDDINIPPDATVEEVEDGYWVSAQVWVPESYDNDKEAGNDQ